MSQGGFSGVVFDTMILYQATANLAGTGGDDGAIWGHFIQFVAPPSAGDPSDQPCPTPTTANVAACIASLVQ